MKLALILACIFSTGTLAEEVTQPAADLPDKPASNTLGKIDAETSANSTIVNIRFAETVDWSDVKMSDHGTFIQIEMPQTIVPNPGDFMEGAGDYVKKMAVFQITPQTGALRLFVSSDAMLVKKAIKADILGDRIMLTVDHEALASLIAADPKVTAAPPSAVSADEVIAATTVDKALPEPAERINTGAKTQESLPPTAKAAVEPPPEVGSGVFQFQDKLLSVSIFCGVLLLGLLFFLVMGPKLRKARLSITAKQDVTMRSLASHTVAPKQKLELIDVAGQQILIGVTPGNINFLTAISPIAENQQLATPQIQPRQVAQPPQKALTANPARRQNQGNQPPPNAMQKQRVAAKYAQQPKQSNEAINDVTKLIREKLKNIPSV